jgi:type I restriction enzyme M protein
MPVLAGRTRIDPSLACLARAVTLLAPGGVLGIVLPDGVLGSPSVRDLLTRGGDLAPLAVVSLPPATFALSGTVARTSALFLRRDGADRPRVVLARVEHVG